ncbi:MAG: hypothetical protein SWK76_07195 [Actinomycetota bacterium]|nr:hypothetical protein [Actinomycetota bacterium]
MAEKIAYLIVERGFLADEDIIKEFDVDDFETIKAKNILCRYYGIAVEKWHKVDDEGFQALFLTKDYSGPDARDLIYKVFNDPDFKTRRRKKEDERKNEIKGEVTEIFERLKEEWGDELPR